MNPWCKLMGRSKHRYLRYTSFENWLESQGLRFARFYDYSATLYRVYYLEYGCFCIVVPCYNAN